ncbi:hypothetical protein Dimus_022515 [Dionaea muscipula]
MHVAACKEFYKNLTVSISKKKEVVRSCVRGVKIELNGMILAGILEAFGNNEICEYIKDIWEESIYCKPLPITRKFANNNLLTVARRVKSTEMKHFQRFLHFIVIKNVTPRFGKRGTTSFMDLTYMDHLLTRKLVNLPRWLKIGENRRRDDEDEGVNNEIAPTENLEENPEGFEWEAVNDEVEIQGEEMEKEVEVEASGSDDKFYDAEVEVEEPADVIVEVPTVLAFPASLTISGYWLNLVICLI